MRGWWRASPGVRARDAILMLTLISHLLVTFGFPLPALARKSKDASRPYPCQNRPCGCLTYDQCWKGDCCCFTLQEKIAWAEANGVEPPAHARYLAESRKSHSPQGNKKACYCQAEPEAGGGPADTTPCCSKVGTTASGCGAPTASCSERPSPDCPHCRAKDATLGAPKAHAEGGDRWVVGIFAQKCRGEGPAGLMKFDPILPSAERPALFAVPEPGERLNCHPRRCLSISHTPPTPPPRRS
jgi:hypothetical protein